MASVLYKAPPGHGTDGPLVVGLNGSGVVYHLHNGLLNHVRNEHLSALTTAALAVFGAVSTPAAPGLTRNNAAGSTTRYYKVVAQTLNGDGIPSAAVSSATLNATPNDTISWTAVDGATGYTVLESADNVTYNAITASIGTTALSFTYTGQATQAYSASGSNPNMALVTTATGDF